MRIRPLTQADKAEWHALWQGYQAYYNADLSDTTEDTWHRLTTPTQQGPFGLVCEDADGHLIGLTHYLFHIHTWGPQNRCYLVDLYTEKSKRQKGVGRALIEAVYEKADAHGCAQVYWLTQDFNTAGRHLYDKVAHVTPFIKYQR